LRERLAGVSDPREPLIAWEQVAPGRWEGVVWEMWDGARLKDAMPGQFVAWFAADTVEWRVAFLSYSVLGGESAVQGPLASLFDAKVWAADMWRRLTS
jgi:hypothetical protein